MALGHFIEDKLATAHMTKNIPAVNTVYLLSEKISFTLLFASFIAFALSWINLSCPVALGLP